MTNYPGDDQAPQDPYSQQSQPSEEGRQQGYWEQQSQQPGYGQYGQQPGYAPQAPMQYAPDHPKSTLVLILGILGIVVCGLIAPFAWVMGKRTVSEIDASQGNLGGRGAAQAGYVLGIVGSVLLGLGVLFMIGMFVIFGLTAVSGFSQY